MPSKRSQHELKRLIEQAAATVWRMPRPGLWFCVDEVEAHGHPPDSLEVWATLHFLPAGSPFCCGEPMCHLGLGEEICSQIGDEVRRMMGLRHQIGLTFAGLAANYHPGVEFHYGQVDD